MIIFWCRLKINYYRLRAFISRMRARYWIWRCDKHLRHLDRTLKRGKK